MAGPTVATSCSVSAATRTGTPMICGGCRQVKFNG
jgi:hypothetical protein